MLNDRGVMQIARQRWFFAGLWGFIALALHPPLVEAHPMGNFSISHYTAIHVEAKRIELLYLIDMAEIPTFQELQESKIVPELGHASLPGYLAKKAEALKRNLRVEINGRRLALSAEPKEIIFPPGAGGLPTLKLMIVYHATLEQDPSNGGYWLHFKDQNYPDRAGWKEIIAAASSGISLVSSSAPERDRSAQLSNYPTDLLNSPPQDLEAHVAFRSTGVVGPVARLRETPLTVRGNGSIQSGIQIGTNNARRQRPTQHGETKEEIITLPDLNQALANTTIQLQANRQATPRNSFTELMATKQLGFGIILIALAVAAGLGAFHALEPGHGKTLVAAYLVGARGTMKHAFLLGLIVTGAHTLGVYVLGAVTLYASQYIVPDRLYPWLGVVSGVMITFLGSVLLVRRYLSEGSVASDQHHHDHLGHAHGPGHHHHHHHGPSHDHHTTDRQVSLRELLTLGISGGIVPCPAALVVLLSAVSMQRIGFGLLLIVAFSVGLAAVLITIGMLMVYARQFMARFHFNGGLITRWLPLTSSAFILLVGVTLTVQSLQTVGL